MDDPHRRRGCRPFCPPWPPCSRTPRRPATGPQRRPRSCSSRDRDGDSEILLMNLDGSGQRQLTANTVADATPVWTPDGDIVFASTRNGTGTSTAWTRTAGTSFASRATADANEFDPAVSSEGDVAFEGNASGNWDVYLLPRDGSDQVRADDRLPRADDFDPAFSPDGGELVFATGDRGTYDIATVEVGGGPSDVNIEPPERRPFVFDPHFLVTETRPRSSSATRETRQGQPKPHVAAMNLQWRGLPHSDGGRVRRLGADRHRGQPGGLHALRRRQSQQRLPTVHRWTSEGSSQRRLTSPGRGINVEADVRPARSRRRPALARLGPRPPGVGRVHHRDQRERHPCRQRPARTASTVSRATTASRDAAATTSSTEARATTRSSAATGSTRSTASGDDDSLRRRPGTTGSGATPAPTASSAAPAPTASSRSTARTTPWSGARAWATRRLWTRTSMPSTPSTVIH